MKIQQWLHTTVWVAVINIICATNIAVAQSLDRVQDISQITVKAPVQAQYRTMQRTVIDTATMRIESGNTLGELLIKNSTINIKSYGRGDVQTATFRGTAPSHTSVYWNGMRINSPMQGMVDFSLIPVYLIDNMAIESGISSITSGSGALGGAVVMESAPVWNNKIVGLDLRLATGSFDTYNGFINLRLSAKQTFQSATKIYYNYSENDFPFTNRDIIDPQNPGWHPVQRNKNGQYRQMGFMQEFHTRLPRRAGNLSLVVMGMDSFRHMPQLTTYEGDQGNNLTDRGDRTLRSTITYKNTSGHLQSTARLGAELSTMSFTQQNRTGQGFQTTINSAGLSRSLTASVDLNYTGFNRHTINSITSSNLDFVTSSESVKKQGFTSTRAEFSQLLGLHSQWLDKLSTSVILRGGVVGNSSGYVSPMLGIEYTPTKWVAIKARGGHNTHHPSISDLYYVPGGNPDLRSERGWTVEAGAEFTTTHATIGANLFSSWIDDWIVWLPSHQQYWSPRNVRNVLARGIEITARAAWQLGTAWKISLNGNLAINSTINNGDPLSWGDESIGKQLVYVPLMSGGGFARLQWKMLWLNYQIYGESSRNTTTSASTSTLGSVIDPYLLHNMSVGGTWRWLSLEVQCLNLLNSEFYTVLRRPLPPRSFMATLSVRI